MNDLTQSEKIALIVAGISARYEDYLLVKSIRNLSLEKINAETNFGIKFITTCRKIAAKHGAKNCFA